MDPNERDEARASAVEEGRGEGEAEGKPAAETTDYAAMLGTLTPEGLEDLVKRANERDLYLDHLRRKAAELENLNKRVERDRIERARYANQSLVREILPVLDNLALSIHGLGLVAEQARKTLAEGATGLETVLGGLDQSIQGLGLVVEQGQKILADAGVTPIEALGKPFDPEVHEAMMQEETDAAPDMTVLAEFVKGYRMHDRVVRPARVKVSRRPAPPAEPKAEAETKE